MGKGQLMEKYKTRHHVILTIRETEGIRIPGDHQIEINNAPGARCPRPFRTSPPANQSPRRRSALRKILLGFTSGVDNVALLDPDYRHSVQMNPRFRTDPAARGEQMADGRKPPTHGGNVRPPIGSPDPQPLIGTVQQHYCTVRTGAYPPVGS